jgi:hypothetical protein
MGRGGGTIPLGEAVRPGFPPLDRAIVKAMACAALPYTGLPLCRLSTADIAMQARRALG